MKNKKVLSLVFLTAMVLVPGISRASSGYLAAFKTTYPASAAKLETCNLCHTTPPTLNNYGSDFAAHHTGGATPAEAFTAIEPLDSDGDGFTNLEEISGGSMPGDVSDRPAAAPVAAAGSATTAAVVPAMATGGSIAAPAIARAGSASVVNVATNAARSGAAAMPAQQAGKRAKAGSGSQSSGNAAVCAKCHNDGRSGATPAGHPNVGGTGKAAAAKGTAAGTPAGAKANNPANGGINTLNNNAAVCANCHKDGRSGAIPAGHPDISQITSVMFKSSGGKAPQNNAAVCSQCHEDGRSGALPNGHPNITRGRVDD